MLILWARVEMSRETTCAVGHLATNWSGFDSRTAALVVNPNAPLLDLLDWCWGEMRSLHATAESLTTSSVGSGVLEIADFSAIFLHRLDPLVAVMTQAMNELHASPRSVRGTSYKHLPCTVAYSAPDGAVLG